tara:strand:+ start:53 stop:184 length:132 start_codon:yes stop_codon:yes gene_type:complete
LQVKVVVEEAPEVSIVILINHSVALDQEFFRRNKEIAAALKVI